MPYRADIDGLRCLAVLSIVLFHADVTGFRGGFVGVDVFFVISGFLIAAIVAGQMRDGRFSFAAFYERRARRILPALFAMMIATAVVASAVMMPRSFVDLGRTSVAVVLFLSNVLFWRQNANYFDAPSDTNPLLHAWSLSVEEQFYLAFPLFMFLVLRFGKGRWLVATGVAAALSFALSIWGVRNAPTATFYLAPTRAWELLVGALLALGAVPRIERRAWNETLGWSGLALIVASVVLFDVETPFPGPHALLPCLGALLIMHSGAAGGTSVARLLGLRPLVFVGLISYSLYLWHWPVIALLKRHVLYREMTAIETAAAIAFIAGLAILSWRYVERPFRDRATVGPRRMAWASATCAATLIAFGVASIASAGWAGRFPGYRAASFRNTSVPAPRCSSVTFSGSGDAFCALSPPARDNLLLWGDSFAAHYAPGLAALPAMPLGIFQHAMARCPPLLGYDPAANPLCKPFNDRVIGLVKSGHVRIVLLSANWQSYLSRRRLSATDVATTIRALRDLGLQVVVIGQSPLFPFRYPDEYAYARGDARGGPERAELTFDPALNDKLRQWSAGAAFFDPLEPFCAGNSCQFRERGKFLFRDSGHFSPEGSRRMAARLFDFLREQRIVDRQP